MVKVEDVYKTDNICIIILGNAFAFLIQAMVMTIQEIEEIRQTRIPRDVERVRAVIKSRHMCAHRATAL